MTISQLLLQVLFITANTKAIWPPGYSINLTQEGTFIIAEDIESDAKDIYNDNDEMIKETDLHQLQLKKDAAKYYQIHRMAMQRNKIQTDGKYKADVNVKVFESNFEHEEPVPWKAGFADKNGNLVDDVRIAYISKRLYLSKITY